MYLESSCIFGTILRRHWLQLWDFILDKLSKIIILDTHATVPDMPDHNILLIIKNKMSYLELNQTPFKKSVKINSAVTISQLSFNAFFHV